jgi:hypothetical protein
MLKFLLGLWLVAFGPQNTSVLQGTVKRGDTSQPIAGVEISLVLPGTQTLLRTTSDDQGRFIFDNLPLGKYTVRAAREGYFTYPQASALPTSVALTNINSTQTHQMVIDLTPGAVIAGRITDPQGRPVSGVQISAMKLQYEEGRPAFSLGTLPKTTDDRGEYRVFWLSPGDYYIRAEYPARQDNLARRSYYPGTLDSGMAAPLTVRGGELLEGMNFSLPTTTSIRISGQVAFDSAGPASGSIRTFYLLPRDGRPTERIPAELVNAISPQDTREKSPNFVLNVRGLAPGSYDLAPFYIEGSNVYRTGRTRIEIADHDIENLTAVLSPNIDVPGRFVAGDSSVQSWNGLQLQLRAKDVAIPLMSRSNIATIAADGTFQIRAVPEGSYYVYLGAAARSTPPDLYISGMRQGVLDIRNEGIIDVRASMLPLEITLSSGGGIVRGSVETATGGIPSHADVVLVPQVSRRSNVMFYDRTIVDEKGQFTFQGIPPGDYKVFAFEQLPETAERNPGFIARYETLGHAVTVNSRSATEIRTRLLR